MDPGVATNCLIPVCGEDKIQGLVHIKWGLTIPSDIKLQFQPRFLSKHHCIPSTYCLYRGKNTTQNLHENTANLEKCMLKIIPVKEEKLVGVVKVSGKLDCRLLGTKLDPSMERLLA